ncbi:MAG: glycoside hydrolase family 16 protein [Crocinitomicaceae bacterium]|nr:glycoside hydrolase family 16 protein [Crocinitomicaceae bacterium]
MLAIILVFLATPGLCQSPKCIEKDYKLVWQDEFDGQEIDRSKWNYRSTGSKRGIGVVRRENCYLDGNGHLIIEATKEDSNYYIGQISTIKLALFKYGYFECRVKLNNQVGPSTAFWLQSPKFGKILDDPGQAGAEIDIMEYRRKLRTNEIHHTVHWNGYGPEHEQKGKSPIHKGVDEGFHTFGLIWTDKRYTFYVDGKKSWCTKKAISHIEQYIILSVELNTWSGDPSNSKFPDKAVYDYVRVYQKK